MSYNSTRISIKWRVRDELDVIILDKHMRFLSNRANEFIILRRIPISVRKMIL